MKKLSLWSILLVAAIAMGLSSCSRSSATLDYIAADADFVMSLNVRAILENAGCAKSGEGVALQGPMAKLLNSSPEEGASFREFLEEGFVDLDAVFATGTFKGDAFMIAGLKNEEKLRKFLKDNDCEIETLGDFSYSQIGSGPTIFWNSDIAAIPFRTWGQPEKLLAPVKDMIRRAEKNPISKVSWKTDILSSDHAFGAFVNMQNLPSIVKTMMRQQGLGAATEILDATLCATFDLSGAKAIMKFGYRDADGKPMTPGTEFQKYLAKIDTGMMEYLNKYDVAMAAGAIKGDFPWKDIIEPVIKASLGAGATTQIAMILPYLEALDGTMIVAGGPRNGLNSFNAIASEFNQNWDIIFAAQLKDGKAATFVTDLRDLIQSIGDSSIAYSEEDGTMKVDILGGPSFFIKADGNNFIIANRTITKEGGSSVKSDVVSGEKSVFAMNLPKGYPALKEIGAEWGVRLTSKMSGDDQTVTELEVYGTDKPLLETVLSTVL